MADDGTFLFPNPAVRISFLHLPSMAYDGDNIRVREFAQEVYDPYLFCVSLVEAPSQ